MAFTEPLVLPVKLTRAEADNPWLLADQRLGALPHMPLKMTAGGVAIPLLIVAQKIRSPKWMRVRGDHLEEFSFCAACGTTKQLNVHHIRPYHKFPKLELDPENLITLCEYHGCHLIIGHLCSWYSDNPDVIRDAAWLLRKVRKRP